MTKNIDQNFLRSNRATPSVELRSTRHSRQAYKTHSHEEFSIGAIVEGSTCSTIGTEVYHLNPGDIILVEPGIAHSCNPIDGTARTYHMLYINTDWCLTQLNMLQNSDDRVTLKFKTRVIQNAKLFETYLTIAQQMKQEGSDYYIERLEYLLLDILEQYAIHSGTKTSTNQMVESIQLTLKNNLIEPPSLKALAEQYGCAQETIIRLFNKHIGIPPKAYLNNCRIEHAKNLLNQGLSIADTAQRCGYSDQAQFHKAFVGYTAATPKQYRS